MGEKKYHCASHYSTEGSVGSNCSGVPMIQADQGQLLIHQKAMALLAGSHIYRSVVFFAETLLLVPMSDLIEYALSPWMLFYALGDVIPFHSQFLWDK